MASDIQDSKKSGDGVTALMNPYAPPVAEAAPASFIDSKVKAAISAWEKLRLIYNIFLLLAGLLSTASIWSEGGFFILIGALIYGIGANICFSLGPLVEVYLISFTKIETAPIRIILFTLGFILSLILTLVPGLSMWL